MAAHKRERKQAAVKVEFGFRVPRETDSRWNWGSLSPVVLVLRWDVGTGFPLIGFTLVRVYAVLVFRWDVGTGLRWYRFTLSSVYG